ncbi:MAG: DUF1553 domain-containing protein, partial [Verrucomicrobiales bacterium]|nr:DUF1553 domain-containing protein [Verrucomicrobiales bacterium]
ATLENRSTTILLRGDVKAPGPEVKPGWPLVFGETGEVGNRPRTALAKWLTAPTNPLTARVWVNRIWQWHFGTGLVKTSGDFGVQGTPPSHPELLDFLAAELMENSWSTKHIHRLILQSATYRQSCRFSTENDSLDPENLTYWRREPRRLESEAIRDSMLSAAGLLSLSKGGPSDPLDTESLRRSLYQKQRRDNFPDQQILFDTANGISSCARRRVSTNSLQPLWLMNSPLSQKSAEALANRSGSVEAAFTLALGRSPDSGEKKLLQKQADQHGLASACLAILNSSEFLYIP